MTEQGTDCAEQHLYDAATAWTTSPDRGPAKGIQAACQALIDGVDSPTLRDLAGSSTRDSATDVRDLITRALAELAIPAVGALPPGYQVLAGGGIAHRPG